jgi:hypothetical protein
VTDAPTFSPRRLPKPPALLLAATATAMASATCGALAAAGAHYGGGRMVMIFVIAAAVVPGFVTALICRRCNIAHYASVALLALVAVAAMNYAFAVVRLAMIYGAWPLWPADIFLAMRELPNAAVRINRITGETYALTRSDVQLFYLGHGAALALGTILSPITAWLVSRYQPPVCPQCGRWLTTPMVEVAAQPPCPAYRFAYQLSQRRFDLLHQLEPEPAPDRQSHLKLAVFYCPMCGGDAYLNVWEVRFDDSVGNLTRLEHRVIRHQIVSRVIVDRLKSLENRSPAPLRPEPWD